MKAIEMLYRMFDEMNFESMRPKINEAIKELEELQSRSCEGCKYCVGEAKQSFCVLRLMPAHMYEFEFCCNRYEAKEQ